MKVTWMAAGALAAAALTAIPAQAQVYGRYDGRNRGRYGAYGYERVQYTRSMGFDRGFRDGLKHGRKDGDKRRSFDIARDNDYRDADNGYHSSYGPRYEYARGYRDGYEEGYRQGYASSRYGYYGGRDRARYRQDDRYRYDDRYYRDDRDRDGYYDRDGRWHPYDGDIIYEEPRRRW